MQRYIGSKLQQEASRAFIHRFKETVRCMEGSQGKGVQTRKYDIPL